MNIDIKQLFDAVLTMLIPLGLGIAAVRAGIFREGFSKRLSSLVLNICQPCLILSSILKIGYSRENLFSGLTVMLVGFLVHGIAMAVSFLFTFRMKEPAERRIVEFCGIFANCGFFGFPLCQLIFGDIGVFWGGFYIIAFNTVMWSYGVFILSKANPDLKLRLTKIFLNSGTIPCLAGFLLYITRVPIYGALMKGVDSVGSICTPVSMILIGAMLTKLPLKKMFLSRAMYYGAFLRMAVMPVITCLSLTLFGFSREMILFGTLMMSLPGATSGAMFAETYDIEPDLAAQVVGLTNLVSLLSIPLLLQGAERFCDLILK